MQTTRRAYCPAQNGVPSACRGPSCWAAQGIESFPAHVGRLSACRLVAVDRRPLLMIRQASISINVKITTAVEFVGNLVLVGWLKYYRRACAASFFPSSASEIFQIFLPQSGLSIIQRHIIDWHSTSRCQVKHPTSARVSRKKAHRPNALREAAILFQSTGLSACSEYLFSSIIRLSISRNPIY